MVKAGKEKKGKSSSRREMLRKGIQKNQEHSYQNKDSAGKFKSIFKPGIDVKFWKCVEGQHIIDILPYPVGKNDPAREEGEGAYWFEAFVHYGVGINEDSFICMNLTGGMNKKCPICEHMQKLKKKGTSDDDVKRFKPKRRAIYNLVCYNSTEEERKGVQIWDSAHYLSERALVELARNPRTGRKIYYADPDEGKSIAFTRTGKSVHMRYEGMRLEDRDEPIPDEILNEAKSIDELIHWPTYEEVADSFFGGEGEEEGGSSPVSREAKCPFDHDIGSDFEQTEDCEECDMYDDCGVLADEATKKSKGKKKAKKEEPVDEEPEDEEEDEEENSSDTDDDEEEDDAEEDDEEEEEEKPAPKRGRRKK